MAKANGKAAEKEQASQTVSFKESKVNRTGHWLRPNEANRYPRRIICLDAEANRRAIKHGERHTFKLAVATYDELKQGEIEPRRSEVQNFATVEGLWSWVDSKTSRRNRTVLWAHNLGYDLRLAQALHTLPRMGWHLDSLCFGHRSCWARWAKEGRSLVMVDFVSFVPRSLERIAGDLGMNKHQLPDDESPDSFWLARCEQDALILRKAVLQLLGWLERSDLGSFRLTGAAQSSAAFRHRFLKRRTLLIHNDGEALKAERRAAWTGRCEVWKHGKTGMTLYEWDYQLAYATIALNAQLPCQLVSERVSLDEMEWRKLRSSFRVLSEVRVKTKKPIVPTENNDRIFWPTGEFQSVLWDDELELALTEKAKVEIGHSWLYIKRPLLSEWAAWIIEQLEGENRERDPIARALIKSWSRQLIGRFGLRYPRWQPFGQSPIADLLYMPFLDVDTKEHGVMFQVGKDLLEQAALFDSTDSSPAIMSAIMAAARIRLWQTMKAVGLKHLYYVDTDSLILDLAGSQRLRRIHQNFPSLRLKAQYNGAEFVAPRNIQLGEETRIAGLPRISTRVGSGAFIGEVWQSTTQSLRERLADSVNVRMLSFQLKGEDYRRTHLPAGETEAYSI